MRILHTVRSANPAGGGVIEVIARLGTQQHQQGSTVHVLTLDDSREAWLQDFPIPVHAVGPVSTKYGYTRRLIPWLLQHGPSYDMIVVNGLWQYPSFAVWRALRRLGRPYVVVAHGMLDPWFRQRYPLKHVKKCFYWWCAEYRVLRDAEAVFFTSEDERRLARTAFRPYACHEKVIPFGTTKPTEDDPALRELFHQRFPEVVGKRVVLFLGRIDEKKGCELLVEAFAKAASEVPSSGPGWHLVLAGPVVSASYRDRLNRVIKHRGLNQRVTWTGLVAGDLKWAAFHAADVFVLPSHGENFGVAVAEALGCGLPVLISNKVNTWREILEAGAGFVEPDDLEGAGRLLARWMALDEQTRHTMRDRAKRCFAARFDARDAAVRMRTVLHSLC